MACDVENPGRALSCTKCGELIHHITVQADQIALCDEGRKWRTVGARLMYVLCASCGHTMTNKKDLIRAADLMP